MASGLDTIGNDSARIKGLIRQRYVQPASVTAAPMATASAATPAPAAASPYSNPPTPPPAAPVADTGNANYGGGFFGSLNGILRGGQGAGYFGAGPNQGILDMVRSLALSDASGLRDHNALMAESLGTDPATAASYGLQSDLNSQGGVAKALSGAGLGELTHQRDFIQQLLMGLLSKQGAQNEYNPQTANDWLRSYAALLQGTGSAASGIAAL